MIFPLSFIRGTKNKGMLVFLQELGVALQEEWQQILRALCCLFNPGRHELARGKYIIREVYIAMFVIRIIQLTIAFNHSYHTCKFDIDWISILLKISKINANFDIIAACSSSPSLLLLPFASCS